MDTIIHLAPIIGGALNLIAAGLGLLAVYLKRRADR